MSAWQEKRERVSALESVASHAVLVLAVAFTLYPVLWVVARAFSGRQQVGAEALPLVHDPTLSHFRAVVGSSQKLLDGTTAWLFGRQLANSVIVSLSTAIRPVVGTSRPAISRSNVDLPQPLRPTTATNSPGRIVRSMPCSTW